MQFGCSPSDGVCRIMFLNKDENLTSIMASTAILEALIPICGGIYGTLLGFKRIEPERRNPKTTVLLAQLRWLGPLVAVFGLWLLWQGLFDARPNVEEIVQGMQKRVTLPVSVDEFTRLDAFDHDGRYIIYRMTITKPPPTDAEKSSLISAMRRHFISQECKSEKFQRLLTQGIALKFMYTIDKTQYPEIVVSQENCGRS